MKKAQRSTPSSKSKKSEKSPRPPAAPDSHAIYLLALCETYRLAPIMQNSYVLSRFWAWLCQVQIKPELRVPMPRFLTIRDP